MPQKRISTKRIAIDKAYATVVAVIAIAVFIVVFSLVASKALLDQRAYQSKVIGTKKEALKTLESNLVAADQLTLSYQEFTGATTNILGGNPQGDADRDGDNARIILDALPSKYDFPALTSSLDKLLKGNGFPPSAITGTDNEAMYSTGGNTAPTLAGQNTQVSNTSQIMSPDPTLAASGVVEMPFSVEVDAGNKAGKRLIELFERSIRPINIQTLNVKGNGSKLEFNINATTYFQPEKQVNVRTEVVR